MLELFQAGRDVENDGAIADADVARDLIRHPLIAPYQVRAERLVILERHHPVRLVLRRGGLPEAGELLVPFRISDLHRQLVGELPLAVFGKPATGDGPCLARLLAGDDPDADPERGGVDRRRRLVFGHRLGIAHGERAELSGRRQPRVRRPGDEYAGFEGGVERRCQLHLSDPVVAPVQRHRSRAAEQLHDERRVLDQPGVALVVGRRIVERLEVVLEAARNHVEVDASPVEEPERRDHLGDGIGMHVDRLHRDERAEPVGVREDLLRHEPRVDKAVVGVDEDPLAPCGFAPARDVHHLPTVSQWRRRERRRAGREHLQSRLDESIGHATSHSRRGKGTRNVVNLCKKRAVLPATWSHSRQLGCCVEATGRGGDADRSPRRSDAALCRARAVARRH